MDARALEYKIAPDVAVEPVTANGVRAEWTSTPNDRTRPAGQLFMRRADFHIAHGRSLVPLVPHPNMARIASRGPPLLSHFFVEVPTSPQMSRPSAEGGTNGSQTLRWREMDSNFRFRARGPTVLRLSGRSGLYDSSLEGDGFEFPVPGHGELCRRAIPPSSPDSPVRKQDASPLQNACPG